MPLIIPEPIHPRGRFAPSPTGPLHLGSLTAALGSWLMARSAGGEWLLRIEDLDPPRELPGMALQHIEDLAAFGMVSDEPVQYQSTRAEAYAAVLSSLVEAGVAFACLCTRGDLAPTQGMHRGCVRHPTGRRPAWRLRVPALSVEFNDAIRGRCQQDLAAEVGDFVLQRSDGLWAYQFAVVVDDHWQRISQVVRGADLLDSTARQVYLQSVLGYPHPMYAHLPLIRGPDGKKLAKSLASSAINPADPLPALRTAFAWLGQDPRELQACTRADQALDRAATVFRIACVPSHDRMLILE